MDPDSTRPDHVVPAQLSAQGRRPMPAAHPTDAALTDATDQLGRVRRRRAELAETLVEIEAAIASPAPGRVAGWTARVRAGLGHLQDDLARHVELTEGESGLYRDVLATAPRLAHAVDKLEREHTAMSGALEDALRSLEQAGRNTGTDAWIAGMRDRITGLLGLFARHRQRGADLVYEAYEADIGGTG